MLNFFVYFPIKLFAAAGLIADCHSPLKTKRWQYYRQKKHNQIVLTKLKSKEIKWQANPTAPEKSWSIKE